MGVLEKYFKKQKIKFKKIEINFSAILFGKFFPIYWKSFKAVRIA